MIVIFEVIILVIIMVIMGALEHIEERRADEAAEALRRG